MCFEYAGICGVEPWRYTFGELQEMAVGRMKHAWDHTALLWATLANIYRDPEEHPQPFAESDVHPYRTAEDYRAAQPDTVDLSGLQAIIERNYRGR